MKISVALVACGPASASAKVLSLLLFAASAGAQDLVYQFDGENSSSEFGEAVDSGRDVNGDGFPDLIVGGHRGTSGARGVVKLFSGLTGDLLHRLEGGNAGNEIGLRVSLLDDLDGDSAADFVHNSRTGARVRSGTDASLLFTVSAVSGTSLLAPFGDWNKDGTPDLMADGRVFSGVDGAELFDFQPGTSTMAVPGDLDDDGHPDLLTYSSAGGEFVARSGVHGFVLYRFDGSTHGRVLSMGDVGDVDADGHDDIGVLYAPPYRVEVHSGSNGTRLYTKVLDIPVPAVYFVSDLLDTTGDLDGDGRDDFLIGGRPSLVISGSTGCEIARMPTDFVQNSLSVSFVGDVQNDGIPDILVGDPDLNAGTGRAVVYDIHESAVGVGYCRANVNSSGFEAHMCATGSTSIAANDLVLRAAPVPVNAYLMFYGSQQIEVSFGDGWRCTGGGISRMFPPGIAFGGVAERAVDLAAEGIQPGTLNFQCWIRDPMVSGAGFNTSDGYSITFVP